MTACSLDRNQLSPSTVQIWQISLGLSAEQVQPCREILSSDENQPADRFHFEKTGFGSLPLVRR